MKLIFSSMTALFLSIGLVFADGHMTTTHHGDIVITHSRARPTLGAMKTTAAFMTIKNSGAQDDRLIGVKGDIAMALELHTHIKEGDVMRMRRVEDGFKIPAGGEHMLAPGSDHIMIMGMTEGAAIGDKLPMTLVFEKAGEIPVLVPVEKIEMHQMNHPMDDMKVQ